MTLKTMINNVQDVVGIPQSSSIISAADATTRQLLGLANQEGRELSRRYAWEATRNEQTFTSVAAEEQTDAFDGISFDRFVNETMYNRTQNRRVVGPLTVTEWQAQKGLTASILTDAFIIRGGAWLATPTPVAGDTYAYSYVSKNWCQSSVGVGQSAWAADNDTGILDEPLMELGLEWRWLKKKGFDYAEEFLTYQRAVAQAITNDGGKRTMNFGNDASILLDARPPTVPEGNWAL